LIGGSKASTRRIVAFEDGYPVQSDNWSRVDKKTGRPVPYDSVYTLWKEREGVKVPVSLKGVRNHKVRPSEMSFDIEWNLGDDVSEDLFDESTLGLLSIDLSNGAAGK
jgi:hypothetical protein